MHQQLLIMLSLAWIVVSILLSSQWSEAYKALVLFPFPGGSHSILGDNLVKLLSEAGNEVTYITTQPREKPPPRVKQIDISGNKQVFPESSKSIKAALNKEISMSNIVNFFGKLFELSSLTLQHEGVQKLLNDPNEKFDVVIVEWMFNDVYAGLAPLFGCPLIWLSSIEPHWWILKIIDDLPSPAYTSDPVSSNQPPFSFSQRVQELGMQVSGLTLQYFYTSSLEISQYKNFIAPIIQKRGNPVPDFEDVKYNVSLVLGNSHVSMGKPTTLPQNYKSVGGYHVSDDVKPLPVDLEKLFQNANHGVIYFSLGSTVKSTSLPDEIKQGLLKIFGELKQTVLWKFEEDLPNLPPNVNIVRWAPQLSILAHNKCILFITHGGILSTIEAVHFGKPIIGVPIFADQFSNIDRAVRKGYGRKVPLSYTMADDLKVAIEEVLGNPRYASKAKELSFIYHHRPVPPGKELVHWVEHVVTTHGAPHLRSPALQLRWYQKWYLDLALLLIIPICGLKMFKIVCVLCGKVNKVKQN